ELHDVLLAFRIDHVRAQAAAGDEGAAPRHVAAALEELAGPERQRPEQPAHEGEFVLGEGGPCFEVRAEDVERGRHRFVAGVMGMTHSTKSPSDPVVARSVGEDATSFHVRRPWTPYGMMRTRLADRSTLTSTKLWKNGATL